MTWLRFCTHFLNKLPETVTRTYMASPLKSNVTRLHARSLLKSTVTPAYAGVQTTYLSRR
jgi:hypothetical protein